MLNIWQFINFFTSSISILVFISMGFVFVGIAYQYMVRKKNTPSITNTPVRSLFLGLGFLTIAGYFMINSLNQSYDLVFSANINIKIIGYLLIIVALFSKKKIVPYFSAALPNFFGKNPVVFIPALLSLTIISLVTFKNKDEATKESKIISASFLFLLISDLLYAIGGPSGTVVWFLYNTCVVASSAFLLWWIGLYSRLDFKVRFNMVFISMLVGILLLVGFVVVSIFSGFIENTAKKTAIDDANLAIEEIEDLKHLSLHNNENLLNDDRLMELFKDSSLSIDFLSEEIINHREDSKDTPDFTVLLSSDYKIIRQKGFILKEGEIYRTNFIESLADKDISTVAQVPLNKYLMTISVSIVSENEQKIGFLMSGYYLDNEFCDLLQDRTGSRFATFRDNIRVSSTESALGGRAIGTTQSDPEVTNNVMNLGKDFVGVTHYSGRSFVGGFSPIWGSEDDKNSFSVIGMVGTGVSVDSLNSAVRSINLVIMAISLVTAIITVTVLQPLAFINEYLSNRERKES